MTQEPGRLLQSLVARGEPAVWVRIEAARGSAPREAGASMVVTACSVFGTIGGGHLEWKAIEIAREMLDAGGGSGAARHGASTRRLALGPALGQCCGGSVDLAFRRADADELGWIDALAALEREGGRLALATRLDDLRVPHSRVVDEGQAQREPARDAGGPVLVSQIAVEAPWHVWIFGAGHVGTALVQVLATLPVQLTWVDEREQALAALGDLVDVDRIAAVDAAAEVRAMPAGADALVLTHSHALDLAICEALLGRDDLGFRGLIGSRTKAESFRRRLAHRGLADERIAQLNCPIGDPSLRSKHPGVIAIGVAHDLWQRRQLRFSRRASAPMA